MKTLPLAAGLLTIATAALAETPVLTVLTYDSFTPEWGPGPAIEKGFEATCGCDVQYVMAGDGAAVLARVQLEGAKTDADVVVGLDTNLTAAASATGLFAPVAVPATNLPVPFEDANFAPFDWGYFAFVYDKTKLDTPPKSFVELAASDLKIIIQDPRSSTPGLGLLMWVKAAYGEGAAQVWADLADNIVTVTPGWSEAYGMFLEGESDLVLSYTTSPAYHLIAETDDTKAAAAFDEGHYVQVEVAGKLASTDQPALADAFLAYLTSDAAQSVLPVTNWMYPAVTPAAGLPAGFETLIAPTKSLLLPAAEAEEARAGAIAEWQTALSR
ncbi:MAG: thiamine ABC transporter substrate binding subunit [Rhodobacterales bacterium RIFCSPHIGHO2_02_FULL_62_130]|nr:MAG: thiamine ABC transporter substrate binding subunit [Rhodobacterales bacterium RIFCSPHIGHO2_02_FULL_62_130]OHC58557.1 MAG: thiamine ABC transporter substrate binding subunit [Rhodobacterales bacterium RIFCSPHIGHO2_12_FULL_62_75]HCY98955.1 thiamine ABC transporter substrate binding subunit [Rhodobacter sp.]